MATEAAHVDFTEGAAPATPSTGSVRIYAKTDGAMYQKDDAGAESALGGAGVADILDIPTAETDTALVLAPDGVGGVEFRAEAGGGPTVIRKASDEVVNNSAALQNDDHLLYALAANEVIAFDMDVWFDASTAADFKHAFTVPAGATLYWASTGVNAASTNYNDGAVVTSSGSSQDQFANGVGTIRHVRIRGMVANSTNAGNLQYQWAQNSASLTDTTVRANSIMIVYPLA